MDREPPATSPEFERQLHFLEDLTDLTRRQERARQAMESEVRRLRSVVEDAAHRLEEMLAGQRASRAELQALINTLSATVDRVAPDESEDELR